MNAFSLDIRSLRKAQEKIMEELKELCDGVLAVKCQDYAAYTEKLGRYHGLRRAMEVLQEVEKDLK